MTCASMEGAGSNLWICGYQARGGGLWRIDAPRNVPFVLWMNVPGADLWRTDRAHYLRICGNTRANANCGEPAARTRRAVRRGRTRSARSRDDAGLSRASRATRRTSTAEQGRAEPGQSRDAALQRDGAGHCHACATTTRLSRASRARWAKWASRAPLARRASRASRAPLARRARRGRACQVFCVSGVVVGVTGGG